MSMLPTSSLRELVAGGEVLEEDAVVADRRKGCSKAEAFIVEAPLAG